MTCINCRQQQCGIDIGLFRLTISQPSLKTLAMAAVADPAVPVSPPILLDEPGDSLLVGHDRLTDGSDSPPLTATATGFNLPPSSSLKANLSSQTNDPVLVDIEANYPAIDYVGRWDASKTARW